MSLALVLLTKEEMTELDSSPQVAISMDSFPAVKHNKCLQFSLTTSRIARAVPCSVACHQIGVVCEARSLNTLVQSAATVIEICAYTQSLLNASFMGPIFLL